MGGGCVGGGSVGGGCVGSGGDGGLDGGADGGWQPTPRSASSRVTFVATFFIAAGMPPW